MYIVHEDYIPEKNYDLSAVTWSEKDKEFLLNMTSMFFQLFEEDKLLAILGVVPTSLVSPYGTLWFLPTIHFKPSFAQLREGKRMIDWFFEYVNYELQAEVSAEDMLGKKFLEYCGMSYATTIRDRAIYRRMQ